MAVSVNLGNIIIADADVPRVQAATRAVFGAGLTDEQIIERLRVQACDSIERMVVVYEKKAATDAAAALTPIIDIT